MEESREKRKESSRHFSHLLGPARLLCEYCRFDTALSRLLSVVRSSVVVLSEYSVAFCLLQSLDAFSAFHTLLPNANSPFIELPRVEKIASPPNCAVQVPVPQKFSIFPFSPFAMPRAPSLRSDHSCPSLCITPYPTSMY